MLPDSSPQASAASAAPAAPAAAAAAQSEAQAAAQLVDLRSISKPPRFAGTEAEWRDWRFVFQSYIGLVSGQLLTAMGNAKNHSAILVPGIGALTVEEQQVSRGLYHILVTTYVQAGHDSGLGE